MPGSPAQRLPCPPPQPPGSGISANTGRAVSRVSNNNIEIKKLLCMYVPCHTLLEGGCGVVIITYFVAGAGAGGADIQRQSCIMPPIIEPPWGPL